MFGKLKTDVEKRDRKTTTVTNIFGLFTSDSPVAMLANNYDLHLAVGTKGEGRDR